MIIYSMKFTNPGDGFRRGAVTPFFKEFVFDFLSMEKCYLLRKS
jgi:hypothetical protein